MKEFPAEIGRELFRVEVGSGLHGAAIAGTDDHDEMGVCLEKPEYFAGLKNFETFVWRTQPEGARSGPGDVDLTVHSLKKFMRLALNGNPTIVQTFFVPENKVLSDWMYYAEAGRAMRWYDRISALAPAVVSRRAGKAYLGYLTAQKQRLTGERGQKDVRRPELVEAHGFDTKFAMHALRLGLQGVELMETGKVTLPSPDRAMLIGVRNGAMALNQILTAIGEQERRLEDLLHTSPLPPEPDFDKVNAEVTRIYMEHA